MFLGTISNQFVLVSAKMIGKTNNQTIDINLDTKIPTKSACQDAHYKYNIEYFIKYIHMEVFL